ncbi:hypothetical protein D9M70_650990 [compost metagenome]
MDGVDQPFRCGQLCQLFGFIYICSQRFFADHVLAGFKNSFGLPEMEEIRGADVYRLNVFHSQ